MEGLWKTDVAFLAALGLFAAVLTAYRLDQAAPDVEVTAAHERAAYEKKVADLKPEDRIALSSPINHRDCAATMSNGYYAHAMSEPRCYARKESK